MYSKCGGLEKAQQVLNGLPIQDAVSWNALIAGYVQHGKPYEALSCIHQMEYEGLSPNAVTFNCALRACGCIGAAEKGEQIHEKIVNQQLLENNVILGNAIVDMYAKCGALEKAQRVLQDLPIRDVVSWTALIAGHSQHGNAEEVLGCIDQMKCDGLSPNAVTFACALRACGLTKAAEKGHQIHEDIVKQGLLKDSISLGSALVDMYAKCYSLEKARQVLHELPAQVVVSWNALIAGYVQLGKAEEALSCMDQMQGVGLSPDVFTFACGLQACGILRAVNKGEQIHEKIVRQQLLDNDIILGTALVDMYAKCGSLGKARQVLHEIPIRNSVSWNSLMAGYVQQGKAGNVLSCIDQMQSEGLSLDAFTFALALQACGSLGAADKGELIHEEIAKQWLLRNNAMLGNVLVDMYAKCGVLERAQQVLDEFPVCNAVPWNALMAGYVQHGKGEDALSCIEQMQSKGFSPGSVTFICALRACGSIGAVDKGEQIHEEIVKQHLLEDDAVLGNALVDMYAKCGATEKAREALYRLPVRDVISWTTLIMGYSQQGKSEQVVFLFDQMQHEGHSPNSVTFLFVLNACNHCGLLAKGQIYFASMTSKYSITPSIKHRSCMVDLFGRAGEFEKAIAVIENMPSCEDLSLWHVLLSACCKWKNVDVGRLAFKCALCLGKYDAATYILMSNIYVAANMHEDANKIEDMRIKNKIKMFSLD